MPADLCGTFRKNSIHYSLAEVLLGSTAAACLASFAGFWIQLLKLTLGSSIYLTNFQRGLHTSGCGPNTSAQTAPRSMEWYFRIFRLSFTRIARVITFSLDIHSKRRTTDRSLTTSRKGSEKCSQSLDKEKYPEHDQGQMARQKDSTMHWPFWRKG